jgi:hypothetical protein
MQFGIGLPNLSYVDPTETLMRLAQAAQELAFDAIWVSDHVFIPYAYAPNYPYSATGRLGLTATDHRRPCAAPSALGMAGIRVICPQRPWRQKPSPCGSSVPRLAVIPPA